MITIPLSKGYFTIVDDIDSDLAKLKWHAHDHSKLGWGTYAVRGRGKTSAALHRLILGRILNRTLSSKEQVDHINRDGLDNRRSNLRLATSSQQAANMRKYKSGKSSKYKGVHWYTRKNKWRAMIFRKYLGYFDSEIEAAKAYDCAARKYFGEYARTNF